MKELLHVSSEPTGAASPLEKQKLTLSAAWARSRAGTPRATAALKMRAPSMWMGMPCRSTTVRMRSSSAGVLTTPPA